MICRYFIQYINYSFVSLKQIKMVKPRKTKAVKKIKENESSEHEGALSLLQKFRCDSGSNNANLSKSETEVNQKESKASFSESEVKKENTKTPQKQKNTLKRPHLKLELESASKTDDCVESKKNNLLPIWEPDNWREALKNLEKMREKKGAPVDTMGCHMAADLNADPLIKRFHFLLALMLSSQTKDQVNYEVMQKLIKLPGGLTVDTIRNIDQEELANLLRPVSFYKTKAKHIKLAVEILKEKYNSDIPKTSEDLCKLPGVGPKMAHICMKTAWNETTGIGVDTHVHRISNRMGWVKKTTKTPEETRISLESWLPKEYWADVNTWMVGLGQTICKPIKPNCSNCLNKDLCPVGLGLKKH